MVEDDRYYLRDPRLSFVSRGGTSWVSAGGDERRIVAVYEDAGVSALLPWVTAPVRGGDLKERLAQQPDLASLVEKLIADGVILTGAREALLDRCGILPRPLPARVERMVLGVTGSVFAATLPEFIMRLPQTLCDRVDLVLTESSRRFVNPQLFEHTAQLGIYKFDGTEDASHGVGVPHVELAHSTDLVVVFPASAHALHRFASGACSDLISLIVTATHAPVVLIPIMNEIMWCSPAVARNIETLRQDGHYVIEPGVVSAVSRREVALIFGGPGVPRGGPDELISLLAEILEIHREHP